MPELTDQPDRGLSLRAIRVVPREVGDEIIAEALETLNVLEQELAEAQVATRPQELEAAARFLIDQAGALVADAQQHRARVMAAARAEAARIIQTAPTPGNGRL